MASALNQTRSPALTPAHGSPEELGLEHRLLAEAVRQYEEGRGAPVNEPQADTVARDIDGDLERRIMVRAQSLTIAPALSGALQQLHHAVALVVVVGLIIAAVAGATTARMTLGPEAGGPVNFFWVLGSILGVQTLALIAWLISIMARPGVIAIGSLGGIAFALGSRLTRWLHKGPIQIAAVQAMGSVYARSNIGRWTLSAISHGLWLAFLIGCLLLVVLILSTKQYGFVWETTILSERTYIGLTRTLALLPEALGFTAPDAGQIAASQWTGDGKPPPQVGEAWSGLLVGSIVVYGILPRALLLGLCLLGRWRASRRFRLDTTRPGFSHLRSRLIPVARPIGIVDREPASHPEQPASIEEGPLPIPAEGPAAILGLEIEPPQSQWPPPLDGLDWLDLGFVDSRGDRRRVLEQINTAVIAPRMIVVVCSLTSTPDRGSRAFIHDLQHSTHIPVVMVLTEGQRLRSRGNGDQFRQRIEDWHRLAKDAQVPDSRVTEIDLDHLTESSRSKLARVVCADTRAGPRGRHIEQSFQVIVEHVSRWSGQPGVTEQAELQRAIAAFYRAERPAWQDLLRVDLKESGNKVEQLRTGAHRMIELLPERLRHNRRWLAAGALAGALGCVAATTLMTPAAIAALPAWAGLGAAVSTLVGSFGKDEQSTVSPAAIDFTEAVSGAALFALVLELQGHDEVTITRIIDRVAEDEPPPISGPDAARRWLTALRQRLDLALAAEGMA